MSVKFKGEGANGFKVALNATKFKEQDHEKLANATQWVAEALGSDEFVEFCKDFGFDTRICSGMWWWKSCRTKHTHGFKESEGLSNEEIYHRLMTGEETLSAEGEDGEADINLELDGRNKRGVLGYTYANSTTQWVYNNFFHNGTEGDVSGNLAHEWVHKMGFGHARRFNSTRAYTVPYAVGYFVRDYVNKRLTA